MSLYSFYILYRIPLYRGTTLYPFYRRGHTDCSDGTYYKQCCTFPYNQVHLNFLRFAPIVSK